MTGRLLFLAHRLPYLRKHSQLLPQWKLVKLGYIALIAVMLAAAIGTYARTGLIGIVVLVAALWLRSDRNTQSLKP